jgi:hypothetical protein
MMKNAKLTHCPDPLFLLSVRLARRLRGSGWPARLGFNVVFLLQILVPRLWGHDLRNLQRLQRHLLAAVERL